MIVRLLFVLLVACDGSVDPPAPATDAGRVIERDAGGSRDSAVPGPDGGANDAGMVEPSPLVRIVFPPASVTDADTIAVRVRVTDVEGATVSVNGVSAEPSGGDFVAEVPLVAGENVLSAQATPASGPALGAEVRVVRSTDLARGETAWTEVRAFSLVVASDEREALYADDIFDGVVRVDLASGDHEWLACTESSSRCVDLGGSGVDMVQPLDVDYRGGAIVATDGDHLVEIDRASHDTRTIAGRDVGSGPEPSRMASMVFDETRSVAVVLDWDLSTITRIDLASGDRELLSGGGAGSGPEIRAAEALAYDRAGDRALFFQQYVPDLYAVDLESGARSIVSGGGPEIGDPSAIAIDAARRVVYTHDDESGALFAIDLAGGDRRVISSDSLGSGPRPSSPSLAFGTDLLFARDETTLYAIDPVSGDRVVVSR
jgi:hypothetical protein